MALFALAHSRHTGKPLHHGRTSYATLTFLLMLCGVLLSSYSISASAASDPRVPKADNPQNGSVGLTGTVRGPAPTQAATILIPGNGNRLTTTPTMVSGKCTAGTFISVYRNGVFAGIVSCNDDLTFNLLVDLEPGPNTLYTKVSDALDQFGPDSAKVIVYFAPAVLSSTIVSLPSPFFLTSDTGVIGISPGQALERTIAINGGIAPYAVNWDFGDGTNVSIPQSSSGNASATHSYSRAGTYNVVVRVTDSSGNTAIIQLVTVVNGPVAGSVATTKNKLDVPGLALGAWPLYILAVLMVVIFWLGERRELYVLRNHNRLLPN
ncbi:MAG: PKD domain-containing protein [Candidatus Saccharibacteria bacterium]